MPRKIKLHPLRQRALDNVWRHGLSDVQKKIVNALAALPCDMADGLTIEEIADLAGLSYGAAWTAIGVLAHFGYISIDCDHKGRAYWRSVSFMYGFKLVESEYDE